jgi:hypothetical protein
MEISKRSHSVKEFNDLSQAAKKAMIYKFMMEHGGAYDLALVEYFLKSVNYSSIENALAFATSKDKDGLYTHEFIDGIDEKCLICKEEGLEHRNISKTIMKKGDLERMLSVRPEVENSGPAMAESQAFTDECKLCYDSIDTPF